MKKNGFTLIELLAVIIILAVIALIATPVILNVVENARKSAFQQSANGYYDAARYLYDEMYLNNDRQDMTFTFDDGVQTSSNEKYKLQIKGQVPKGGMVYLTKEGEILVSIHNGKYCATTNGMGQVSISKDVENCGHSSSECFTYSDFNLDDTVKGYLTEENLEFEGMNDALLQVDSFDNENPSCRGIVIIPEEHEGRKIEGIKESAFQNNDSITAVVLPKELKVIDNNAFRNASNLKQVIMNNELRYIGTFSFLGANIENIVIPEKVLYLGGGAFIGNGARKVTLLGSISKSPNYAYFAGAITVPVAKNNSPFMSKEYNNRKNVIEEVIIGNNVTMIPNNLFRNQKLTKVVIPDSVTAIGSYAFSNNQLTSVTIPDSVTTIGGYAFSNNQLANITIPDSVTTIPIYAFSNNQLTSVTIPDSVTTMGKSAFSNNKISNLKIGSGLTTIIEDAFSYNLLTELIIPSNITSIEKSAFIHNPFTDITFENLATTYDGNDSFYPNESSNGMIYGYDEEGNKTVLLGYVGNSEKVVIPEGIKTIKEKAFANSLKGPRLTQLTLPNGLISIGEQAFLEQNLTSVVIPDSVESIGEYAFATNKIESLTLGEGLKYLSGFSANQLTTVTIPDGVTTIGVDAFSRNKLTNVTIPDGVTTIEVNAFAVNPLGEITIPNSVTYLSGFSSTQLKSVIIPAGVTTIGIQAFSDNQLTSITIPAGVTAIGSYAFSRNEFPNANAIKIEGNATRFDSDWTKIGFPAK